MKKIIIEGWRNIPHSYAIVNQFQILSLLKRSNVQIIHKDVPFYNKKWAKIAGLFSDKNESLINSVLNAADDMSADVCYRISAPYDYSLTGMPTYVFGTAEYRNVGSSMIRDNYSLQEALSGNTLQIITPSVWSGQGFVLWGAPKERVHVIHHGVDPHIFYPHDSQARQKIRSGMGISPDDFVFLNVGMMAGNKGVDLLLRAFAEVLKKHKNVKLLLKGNDSLYRSLALIKSLLGRVGEHVVNQIKDNVIYFGSNLSFQGMASIYNASNAYVSPYRGEGFNLPVLEAMASGVPVICTAGGSTEDFTQVGSVKKIKSTLICDNKSYMLKPDFDSLVFLMNEVIEDDEILINAASVGVDYVRKNFTWDHAVDKMLGLFFPDQQL